MFEIVILIVDSLTFNSSVTFACLLGLCFLYFLFESQNYSSLSGRNSLILSGRHVINITGAVQKDNFSSP